ncbi:MAG TPA: hypothetical protein VM553_07220 [Dongiaceae bacterium]|nr:hypothetical protein [Dongiaceae bacterium]
MMKIRVLLATLLWMFALSACAAAEFDQQLLVLQEQWAQIQYQTPDKQKEAEFEKLAKQLQEWAAHNPGRPEPLIWRGIVLSTWAGAKGGLGALGLVKEARGLFEQSLTLAPDALQGSAYTSLGSLYYQVPGWPIGFGDDKKARELLEKAIKINPDGIDSNYFYADYWLDQGDYPKAKQYFSKALQAPARPDRPLADAGRRNEIQAKLAKVEEKLR